MKKSSKFILGESVPLPPGYELVPPSSRKDEYSKSFLSKEEIKNSLAHQRKLDKIWQSRPEGLTFPPEYLDIKKKNTQIYKEVEKLNEKIDSLLRQAVQNTERASIVLRDFIKDKSEEELAQYIKPNQIYLSTEEILISYAGDKIQYKFRPASCILMYPGGLQTGFVRDDIEKDANEVNVEITDEERKQLLGQ